MPRVRRALAGDSPGLRLELTCDDEPIVYCAECWKLALRPRRDQPGSREHTQDESQPRPERKPA